MSEIQETLYLLFWESNSPFARVIIILIGASWLIATGIFLSHRRRYNRENRSIAQVEKKLLTWQAEQNQVVTPEVEESEDEVTDDSQEEDEDIIYQPTMNIGLLQENLSAKTAIHQRLSTLSQLKKARVKVSVDVLQKLTRAGEAKKWTVNFPSYVMNLTMLLGMLGTFYGLTIMVQEIGHQLSDLEQAGIDDFQSSLNGIKNVLGGVNTAFSTTLAGLACTLVVSAYNFVLKQSQAAFFDYLESVTAEKLLPFTFPHLEEGDVLDEISDRLKDSFEELNDTIDKNNDTLQNLDGIYARFNDIISQVREITTRESSVQLQDAVLSMNGLNENLHKLIKEYRTQDIIDEISALEKSNKSFVKGYNRLLVEAGWIPSTKVLLFIMIALLAGISGLLTYSVILT